MSKFAVYEIFEALDKIENKADRLASLQTVPDSIRTLLSYWVNPEIEFLLPPGEPPYEPANKVGTDNLFWSEIRRLKIFIKGPEYQNLTSNRREQLFINMIEHIHPKDAKLVVNLVNKTWPYTNFTLEDVLTLFKI